MFQTELNHYLQSFASDGLTAFMRFITGLGYEGFLFGFLLFILLSVNFRKGFLMTIIFLWVAAITFFMKEHFDLPRPFHVDNTIELLDGELPDEARFNFEKRGATTFWGGLPADVLVETRKVEGVENGFPSGHTSIAIGLWGALGLLFRKRWIGVLSVALMILSPLSRMYLGVHFLADVLGGVALGGSLLWIFYASILRPNRLNTFMQTHNYTIGINGISFLLLIAPLFLFFFLPIKYYTIGVFLWSFGLGFMLLAKRGLPLSDAPILHRIGRTVIGVLIFGGVGFAMIKLLEATGLRGNTLADFVGNVVIGLGLTWLSIEISIRLGWFKRITA